MSRIRRYSLAMPGAGLLAKFENPLLGIAVGAIFQSSPASVRQTLALSGVVTLPKCHLCPLRKNIGT